MQASGFFRKTSNSTGCPTRCRTRHFFNNSNTNEDVATKFEQQYVLFFHISYTMRYVRFKFRCNIIISGKIIKEMPGSVENGTPCTFTLLQAQGSLQLQEIRLNISINP